MSLSKKTDWLPLVAAAVLVCLAGCGKGEPPASSAAPASAPARPKLGIRPYGDETVKIDMSKIHAPELKKIFEHIDTNIDDHVLAFQRWVQQPSISNTGEGMQESAEMVKGM